MHSDEEARLLQILQAHGQSFMQSFGTAEPGLDPSSKKRKRRQQEEPVASTSAIKLPSHDDSEEDDSEAEWGGVGEQHLGDLVDSDSDSDEEENDSGSDFEHTDDEFTSAPTTQAENVVVFSDPSYSHTKFDPASKAQMKAFLVGLASNVDPQSYSLRQSSKVSKVTGTDLASSTQRPKTKQEEEDEKTNTENDRLLHKLVHTKLLSGALNTELDLTPAQRRKALEGRVLELTGGAKMGKGERIVRKEEKNNAAKRVREGLARKQKESEAFKLEEAKNLGNYHPALKKLYESSEPEKKVKRERGMKVGVGSFKGGMLRLNRDDIQAVTGTQRRTGPQRSKGGKAPKKKSRR